MTAFDNVFARHLQYVKSLCGNKNNNNNKKINKTFETYQKCFVFAGKVSQWILKYFFDLKYILIDRNSVIPDDFCRSRSFHFSLFFVDVVWSLPFVCGPFYWTFNNIFVNTFIFFFFFSKINFLIYIDQELKWFWFSFTKFCVKIFVCVFFLI